MKKIGLLFLLFTLTASLTGLSCNLLKKTSTTTSPTPTAQSTAGAADLTAADPSSINDALGQYLATAKDRAQEWKKDAVLVETSIKLPKDLSLGAGNQTYVFGSSQDTANWWTISISEKTGKYIRATIPKEDYLGSGLNPINEYYWKTNYLEAFQLAEKNGGKDFRTKNQGAEVNLTLAQEEPKGWLWWEVEYKSPTGETSKIRINPYDKTAVDESGNVVTK